MAEPPYGTKTEEWLRRMEAHGDGIALTFARTDTEMFHEYVFPFAHALLFLRGRLHFHDAEGSRARMNAGGPSVLIAYGEKNRDCLATSGIEGCLVRLR